MSLADELAAALRPMYAHSQCQCEHCIRARTEAARALVHYDDSKAYMAELAREVTLAFDSIGGLKR